MPVLVAATRQAGLEDGFDLFVGVEGAAALWTALRRRRRAAGGAGRAGDAADRGGAAALRRGADGGGDPHGGVRGDGADGARHLLHQGVLHGAGSDHPHRPSRPREPAPARPAAGRRSRPRRGDAALQPGDGEGRGVDDQRRLVAAAGADGRARLRPPRGGARRRVRAASADGPEAAVVRLPFERA